MMHNIDHNKKRVSRFARMFVFCGLSLFVTIAEAGLLNLSDTPLYLLASVSPNILVTVDDSGSMAWGFVPDCIGGMDSSCTNLTNTRRGCAPTLNGLAYNPTISYVAGVDQNGNSIGDASFTGAWFNGYQRTTGVIVNLSTSYRYKWVTNYSNTNTASTSLLSINSCATAAGIAAQPAYYYLYDPVATGCVASVNTEGCYKKVIVSSTSGPGASDERQNFANWYSYYSTRNLMVKTAAGRSFSKLGTNVRLAYQHLSTCGGYSTAPTGSCAFFGSAPTAGCPGSVVKDFNGSDRSNFFTWLYNTPANNSTPLVPALYCAGRYLTTTGVNSPWAQNPGVSQGTEYACRQNFHVALTDGYWNSPQWGATNAGGVTATASASANIDNAAITLPDGKSYSPAGLPVNGKIYPDTNNLFLADQAFYFWSHDLRPDLTTAAGRTVPKHFPDLTGAAGWSPNTIPPTLAPDQVYFNPVNDPADWHHLVTYTIGLGVSGLLTSPTDYNSLLSGAKDWNGGDHVDDLWHAAVNGRGRYFNASDPSTLVQSFDAILADIVGRISSASSVSLNAGSLSTKNLAFQARFNSGDWSGQLLAYKVDSGGSLLTPFKWDAGQKLNLQDFNAALPTGRSMITYKPSTGKGVAFRWPVAPAAPTPTEIDLSQVTALNTNPSSGLADAQGNARLNYLRGDASNEGAGYNYRVRSRTCSYSAGLPVACPAGTNSGVLGDAINSNPIYVPPPPFSYPDTGYSTFRTTYKNRTPMLYVGANDGALHGFDATDATTGNEKLAYVPSIVYANLAQLPSNPYVHKYFVDGNPSVGDAAVVYPPATGADWNTVLVGGLRKGGQGYYALNITDPSNFTESNAATLALWEFSDANDKDMGYSYGDASIVQMSNGRWAAIVSNGYNNTAADSNVSTTGNAVLYILMLDKSIGTAWSLGTNYFKIDTGVGKAQSSDLATPNGLATPTAVDVNNDNKIDYAYAGDLQGNLWKFDLRGAPSTWTATSAYRLFIAKDSLGNRQPITSAPTVSRHLAGLSGYMVYFGTGKYMEVADSNTTGALTQTFYGIWDDIGNESALEPQPGVSAVTRSTLLQQIVATSMLPTVGTFRSITNNPLPWRVGSPAPTPSYVGWYIDLPTLGERDVYAPLLRNGALIFTTVIPSNDPCTAGGTGWLMEVNPANGGALAQSPFDTNGDGVITVTDLLSGTATGGKFISNGVPASPAILAGGNPAAGVTGGPPCGGKNVECKLISTTDGSIQTVVETGFNYTRQSWRQFK